MTLSAIVALTACGDDTTSEPIGAGGADSAATGGTGGSGTGGIANACVGCGELITSSEPGLSPCEGSSRVTYEALVACICQVCAGACSGACSWPPAMPSPAPGCNSCEVMASQQECKAEHDACLEDVR